MSFENSMEASGLTPELLHRAAGSFRRGEQDLGLARGGIDYGQVLCIIAAAGVASAYATYPCIAPDDPNYTDFNVIQVGESGEAAYRAKLTPPSTARMEADKASAGCGYPYLNFGFTATSIDGLYNILVLRGTADGEEAGYDLYDWDDVAEAVLPTQVGGGSNRGNVKQSLWDFYSASHWIDPVSLAQSCMDAVKATEQAHPGLPWLVCGHSLGGPMANLAAYDAVLSGFMPRPPLVMTFGSLHLGDATFAGNYDASCPLTVRIANLSDFVPAMIGLLPGAGTTSYVHVGELGSFVWQTWNDWQNHSMTGTYLAVVGSDWDTVQFGNPRFPCATAPSTPSA